MRLVCVSDTHLRPPAIPDGDILVHAGDLTMMGRPEEVARAGKWLRSLPHRHKVVIAGNHDFLFETERGTAKALLFGEGDAGLVYLEDEEVTLEGVRFYGSPWTPRFFDWAFNEDRGEPLRRRWSRIPDGIDVLVTHGPPHGILDRTHMGVLAGCEELRTAIARLQPRLHVFGHIHEGWGTLEIDGVAYVNASTGYRTEHAAIVRDL